ncbi:hypothetical protein [Microbacterium aurantiacum]|uniref:hypothetical protein n=1 Tax=Microbacterium aurantiacum TaxID=162393 RepID=UPI000C7FB75D|nr:hypothetical protein [Microbacterium aurantiacum]
MTKQTPETAAALSVAAEIRAEMARQRKTASELALVLGITQHTAGKRLNGSTTFNLVELFRAVSWLGLSLEEIAHRAEAPEQKAAAEMRRAAA